MENIPVVFVHEGGQSYLRKTIQLAEKYNSDVYLIGDKYNKRFCKNWISNNSLNQKRFKQFSTTYKHMSTNSYQFELNCFKRFYLLLDFMKQKQFKSCIMLDSDLCTYINFSKLGFEQYDVVLSIKKEQEPFIWSASTHCSFWTCTYLENFISFFENIYSNQIDSLLEKWNWHQSNNIDGGICDMTLLYLWIKNQRCVWLNLAKIYKDMVFDHNIALSGNYVNDIFVMDAKYHIKKVRFSDHEPLFILKENNTEIKVATIHASGNNKKYIPVFYKYYNHSFAYKICNLWSLCKIRIHSISNRIHRKQ